MRCRDGHAGTPQRAVSHESRIRRGTHTAWLLLLAAATLAACSVPRAPGDSPADLIRAADLDAEGELRSVHLSDLDDDGDIDLLSAYAQPQQILWYENTGAGRFSEARRIGELADREAEKARTDPKLAEAGEEPQRRGMDAFLMGAMEGEAGLRLFFLGTEHPGP